MCARFRDPAAQNYAIGDFAKKAGVSTHFLKFYEEKGILHPRVQENGYRYYDIRDASLVLECFRMKNMGLSVRQIEKGINDCTEQEVAEMLQQRENVLQSQLHEQQMHLQGLQNLRVALRLCEQGEWSVRTVPDVWYLPHTIGKEFVQDSRIYDQLPQWLEGWTKTEQVLDNSKQVVYALYCRTVQTGETVTLGSNGQVQGCVQYTVFAVQKVGSGDVNGDGQCTVADAVMLQKFLIRAGGLANQTAADLSGDGVINGMDLVLLKRQLLVK